MTSASDLSFAPTRQNYRTMLHGVTGTGKHTSEGPGTRQDSGNVILITVAMGAGVGVGGGLRDLNVAWQGDWESGSSRNGERMSS